MLSAAEYSDFLLYEGMGDIMYDLRWDGSFHSIDLERDVFGKAIGAYNFGGWERRHFVVWSAACGCSLVQAAEDVAQHVLRSRSPRSGVSPALGLAVRRARWDRGAVVAVVELFEFDRSGCRYDVRYKAVGIE